jgi:hypothetical protein
MRTKILAIVFAMLLGFSGISFALDDADLPSKKNDRRFITIHGHDTSNTADTAGTLWNDSTATYTFATTHGVWNVSSSSTNDDVLGTGARKVYLEGLTIGLAVTHEIVDTDGTTAAATANQYYRMNLCRVVEAGTVNTNDGIIYVGLGGLSSGRPDTRVYCIIEAGAGVSKMGVYTTAANYQLYLTDMRFSVADTMQVQIRISSADTNSATYHSMVKGANPAISGTVVDIPFDFETPNDNTLIWNFRTPYVIDAKRDIEMRGTPSTVAGQDAMGMLGGILTNQ